jgi:phage terminase large subunit-like protein
VNGFIFHPVEGAKYRRNYEKIARDLNVFRDKNDWKKAIELIRKLCWDDLFFLMYFVLGWGDMNHPWLVDRANEVNDNRHKTLDVWSRYHYKSSIITVAGTIQDALRDPMIRGCIFSHTKSIAKDFLRRIKTILETNGLLAAAFEDVIPANPMNTKGWLWSLDDGLQLKCGNEIGGTLQASGLIDSMPTGKHFTRRIYDDVVTREAVSTSEQRNKVSECVRLSHALGDPKNGTHCFIGTRYHFGDFYGELIRGGGYTVREYACTHNGAFPAKPVGAEDDVSPLGDGRAVLYTQDHIWEEFKNMGTATFASQMLMDPIKADEKAFDVNWIRYYNNSTARPHTRNFIFADPAGSKKEGSAYTVMWVVGVDQRNYYYILDCVRDRLDLQQKQRKLFDLVAKWKVIKVYYEKYSMQGDIEYIEEKKREEGFHFPIEEVGGTRLSKDERILKLQPLFQEGRMIFPEKLPYTDCNGKLRNLVDDFIMEEYNEFPVSQYKDMLDALSRLRDEKVKVAGPAYVEPATHETDNPILRWHRQSKDASNGNSWLNA